MKINKIPAPRPNSDAAACCWLPLLGDLPWHLLALARALPERTLSQPSVLRRAGQVIDRVKRSCVIRDPCLLVSTQRPLVHLRRVQLALLVRVEAG
jgi:hypothetical protein